MGYQSIGHGRHCTDCSWCGVLPLLCWWMHILLVRWNYVLHICGKAGRRSLRTTSPVMVMVSIYSKDASSDRTVSGYRFILYCTVPLILSNSSLHTELV